MVVVTPLLLRLLEGVEELGSPLFAIEGGVRSVGIGVGAGGFGVGGDWDSACLLVGGAGSLLMFEGGVILERLFGSAEWK